MFPESPESAPMPGLGLEEPPRPKRQEAYRVLARKYRPQSFFELIGQEAMVQTLANAIKRDRLAHAFLLTGVRGVGKTSTARLIAKALNCIGQDGSRISPTIDPCGVCEPCVAITEGRFIDVLEMDAASNTKVEQMRELLDGVVYSTVSARFKIYIIDEVHMLSNSSFNALLKTLEEPPAHVKFLFATTEVQKVPVTVLSRCQRFDLRRIPAERLGAHFAEIAKAEAVEIEPEALALIARAAEGSARDGLSILDQAIAHGGGAVTADEVRAMLGLSDRGAIRALLGLLLAGEAKAALVALRDQYDLGVEPSAALRGLLEATHGITRAKVGADVDLALSGEERAAYAEWAMRLSFASVHRLWQLLLKGLAEVHAAPSPLEAAEMALLRVIHAAELPDPGELVTKLRSGESVRAPAAPATSSGEGQGALLQAPADFAAFVRLLADEGEQILAHRLAEELRVVDYAPPVLKLQAARALDAKHLDELLTGLRGFTKSLFGQPWRIAIAEGEAQPSLREQELASERAAEQRVREIPVVKAALEAFPDATIERYTLDEPRSA